MSMQAYLAQNYMTGPKADAILARAAPKKKKKRKADALATPGGAASGSAMIVDADGGWGDEGKAEAEDETSEAVVEKDRGFKKRRVAGEEQATWHTIQPGIKEETPPPADEEPTVVDAPFAGGLLTADQLRKALPKSKGKAPELTQEEAEAAQETVYRDASGRVIDTKAAKADAARKKREKQEKEAQKMEWGKGLVQRDEQEKRRLELEKQKTRGFARYADDQDLNEDLKAQDRWNDPAAAFISKKTQKGPRKPQYAGPPPPPNRFAIKPGYRWDGVDRGNGFEKKLFQHGNERKRKGLESYQWGAEDM
ncbi:hypothetical protein FIBSPDRAFT_396354 [Athelia psychrophila]|uniref:Pre-mRNA-splicing factor CWC26 n=1 Tax=Athelia psychrophila TaxID=1759441 RepID=A0A166NPH7_9AGAM|nr:hypothetical protein FIBSPDRAFT_396354 [Fibularhizoctonia sp. CBS 109695]